ncbi:Thiamine biosynthesis protein [uncultured Desulfobacterium sp.]|uniref:Thiamine biosynthesis protein n=1 Tax=uncultured Desulfobacterium sp. TaxID=201089 RepID=A0A445N3G6_9BACT|nr:Thiamine biosynthesis protein [uncultured Desulfobacterium sp.]
MKALCVFSGGLDSMLAADLIRAQGIDVLALFFETPFFTAQRAVKSAGSIDIPLKVVDITKRHLKVVRNPIHGYGGNMNPCIDCHALMFRIAGEMLDQERADFIITGEVLGQRPMSQNKQSLRMVASESGYANLLLRPLSAKLLPLTLPEEKGWVNRDLLMDFQGRTRKPQMEMAALRNFNDYPSPAGGCLLTEKVFSRRLKDLFTQGEETEIREIEILKLGRHFRLAPVEKIVVGRNKTENEAILALSKDTDYILTSANGPGPVVLALGDFTDSSLALAASITASYSDAKEGTQTPVKIKRGEEQRLIMATAMKKTEFVCYML